MKINKKELLEALEIVKPALANKETDISQSTSFAFLDGHVVTYNDEISLSHPLKNAPVTGAVKAEELYQLLSKTKKDEIEVDVQEKEIQFRSGRSKAGLVLQAEVTMPLENVKERSDWVKLPENIHSDFLFAAQTCSKEMARPVLTCVHINPEGYIESSDGYSISRIERKVDIDTPVLIPASSVREAAKIKPINIALGDGWVHFQAATGTVLSCRVFEDKYPAIGHLMEVEGLELTFPKNTLEVLERAAVFAKRDHYVEESIAVKLMPKRMFIRSESDSGWFEEALNLKYDGEPREFSVTPYLLKRMVSSTQNSILADRNIKFAHDNWEYVAMLQAEEE